MHQIKAVFYVDLYIAIQSIFNRVMRIWCASQILTKERDPQLDRSIY